MKIVYIKAVMLTSHYILTLKDDFDFSVGFYPNECEMIVPDFVRPIHYSIFEDE